MGKKLDDETNQLLDQLDHNAKTQVVMLLKNTRWDYLQSKVTVGFAQYFYACNMHLFAGMTQEDIDKYTEIDEYYLFFKESVRVIVNYMSRNAQ